MVLHGIADSNARTSDAGARTRGRESAHKRWQPAGTGRVQPSCASALLVPCSLSYQEPGKPAARSPFFFESFPSHFNHFRALRPVSPISVCYTRIRGEPMQSSIVRNPRPTTTTPGPWPPARVTQLAKNALPMRHKTTHHGGKPLKNKTLKPHE